MPPRSSKSKTDDSKKSKPSAADKDDSQGEKESAAAAATPQKKTGRKKKVQSAAMGLMSLMSPNDKAAAEGKEEEVVDEAAKKPEEATATDDVNNAPSDQLPPPVHNPMAMQNSFPLTHQANLMQMNTGYMYPPPNMMNMPMYPPLNIPGPSNPSLNGGKSFPEILFEVVSNPKYQDIISWLSHGQGFQIHNKQQFAKQILPEHFDGAKFTSFTRRLKRWSFTRVSRGPELGAYYNKNFVKGHPELVQLMRYSLSEDSGGGGAALQNGGAAPGFPMNNGDNNPKLPDQSQVTGTMTSMRQVHNGILPQMPDHSWFGSVVYGSDGLIQLPKPSQLPKRGTTTRKSDGTESSPKKKKITTDDIREVQI